MENIFISWTLKYCNEIESPTRENQRKYSYRLASALQNSPVGNTM